MPREHGTGEVGTPRAIIGANDFPVIEMNRDAYDRMQCERRLEIVPGAGHLFEEPDALEEVARLARQWFERVLR